MRPRNPSNSFSRATLWLFAVWFVLPMEVAEAQKFRRGGSSTPRIYGSSNARNSYYNRPRWRSGQTWRGDFWRNGYRNRNVIISVPQFGFPAFPPPIYGYPGFGYPYYSPAPVVINPPPIFQQPLFPPTILPFNEPYSVLPRSPVIDQGIQQNLQRWNGPVVLPPGPVPIGKADPIPRLPAGPDAVKRSLAFQLEGDEHFRKGDFLKAAARYESAITAAPDRSGPYARHAYALTAVSQFDRAVVSLKKAVNRNPHWPRNGIAFKSLFGKDGEAARLLMVRSVAAWVKQDIRDPDRLFLMGSLLHFDQPDKARTFFETAWRLAGKGEHLAAFLRPAKQPAAKQKAPQDPNRPLILRGASPEPKKQGPKLIAP